MTPNPTTPAPTTEELSHEVSRQIGRLAAQWREGEISAQFFAESTQQQIDQLTTALAEAKARCAELTEKLTDTMDARNVAWLDLAHMKARAESAEAQRDRMKVALESVEVLEEYSGKAGRRQYGKLANVWLYPGDAIATISIFRLKPALSTPPAEEKP